MAEPELTRRPGETERDWLSRLYADDPVTMSEAIAIAEGRSPGDVKPVEAPLPPTEPLRP